MEGGKRGRDRDKVRVKGGRGGEVRIICWQKPMLVKRERGEGKGFGREIREG